MSKTVRQEPFHSLTRGEDLTAVRPVTQDDADVRALAQSFLDRKDEDWTYVDPEDVKRLARAVLGK